MCETTEPEKETQPQRLKRKIVKDGRVSSSAFSERKCQLRTPHVRNIFLNISF